MLHNAFKMASISDLLEEVVIDNAPKDVKPLSKNLTKLFPLSKVISKNKALLIDITHWQWKIAQYTYELYNEEVGCVTSIDISKVLVDKDKKLVEIDNAIRLTNINEDSEAVIINTILNVHMSMLKLVNEKHFSKNEFTKFNILRIFSNYFYSAIVSDMNGKVTVAKVINYCRYMHTTVSLGLFDEINSAINDI